MQARVLAGRLPMASLVARTAQISRPWSSEVAGIWRSEGRSLSSSWCLHRTYSDVGLDGRVLASPEASSAAAPVVDTLLSPEFLSDVQKTKTVGADRTVYDRNAGVYRTPRGVPIAILDPQLSRIALNEEVRRVGECMRAFMTVPRTSCRDSPTQSSVSGEELPIGSARELGNRHLPSASTTSEAIAILNQGLSIDSYMFVEILKRCSEQKDLIAARQLHEHIIQSGMDKNPYVMNTLLNVYIRCGRLQDARRVFDAVEKKDAVTWRIMIGGYAANDHAEDAVEVFKLMRQGGAQPDERTCLSVLKACASPLALEWGKELHAYIGETGLEANVRVGTALVHMYAKCGCITEARRVFEDLTNRNIFTWNVMIGAYAQSGIGVEAYRLFLQMKREGFIPDAITYMSILNASARAGALQWVREVHHHARREGLESDFRVGNALVHMYAKSGSIDDARLVFDRMDKRDVITWNSMIGAYAETGSFSEAYRLLLEMKWQGFRPNAITYVSILNASAGAGPLQFAKDVHGHARRERLDIDLRVGSALVHMYGKCGIINDARLLFDRMKKRDVASWNIMIGACAESGSGVEAYRLFFQMKREGFMPNAITFVNILNPSASAGALEWVTEVHRHAVTAGLESDARVGNALVHMYSKIGSIDDALLVFERMEKRDVVTWNIMIGGLAQHGCGQEALELFRAMNADRVKPDETSFVAVLSGCCHAGLLDEGRKLFLCMKKDFGIEPTVMHYTCMVDLLGRAGHLDEAKLFIGDMPVEPNGVTWKALLGACRTYGNVELGELAAKEVLKLEPKDASAYVLLSNIYAAAGKWEKVSSVRRTMQERGVAKEQGRSWIEVENKIHEFVVRDTSHPEAKAIYAELNKLTEKLKAEGYVPDTQLVLRNINVEDKELALCSHSEKLAIVYGLMRTPHGKPIRVYKNLRVCSDCHRATRFISKVTGREIVLRDAIRFHHFKDGECSCCDFW